MAVCSFLGHSQIYDTEIDSMLEDAINRIVDENGKTEFLLYLCNDFYNRCFLAVLKAKARRPESISITLVPSKESEGKQNTGGVPDCLIDRIIYPDKDDYDSPGHKKIMRWLLRQSTHLVSCLYKTLCEPENRILDYAKGRENLRIIDITNADTSQEILNRKNLMSDRERFIFDKIAEGTDPKEISQTMSISTNRLRQVLKHGCRTIRESMRNRYYRLCANKKEGEQQSICSIFSVGEVTRESLNAFEYIINFLRRKCGVTHFEISSDIEHSGFMYVLEKAANPDHIFCNAEVAPAMINSVDFCVCSLPDTPAPKETGAYISQAKHTVLVDMSQVKPQMQAAVS